MKPHHPCLLWDLRPEEHAAYVAAGCGTETMEQYRARILREQEYAKWMGRDVVMLSPTVAEVLAELARIGLRCTAAGIALALLCIFERGRQQSP